MGCERADNLFDQIEKIQNKDFVKLNRSLLHSTVDRGDSAIRHEDNIVNE